MRLHYFCYVNDLMDLIKYNKPLYISVFGFNKLYNSFEEFKRKYSDKIIKKLKKQGYDEKIFSRIDLWFADHAFILKIDHKWLYK